MACADPAGDVKTTRLARDFCAALTKAGAERTPGQPHAGLGGRLRKRRDPGTPKKRTVDHHPRPGNLKLFPWRQPRSFLTNYPAPNPTAAAHAAQILHPTHPFTTLKKYPTRLNRPLRPHRPPGTRDFITNLPPTRDLWPRRARPKNLRRKAHWR